MQTESKNAIQIRPCETQDVASAVLGAAAAVELHADVLC